MVLGPIPEEMIPKGFCRCPECDGIGVTEVWGSGMPGDGRNEECGRCAGEGYIEDEDEE